MADKYVYSGAGGAGTGADWANAYTTLAAALTGGADGDRFFVAHDHSESTAGAVTWSKGTAASPCQILCVNRAGSVPPVSADLTTGASLAVTGVNNLTTGGHVSLCQGLTISVADGTNAATLILAGTWNLKTCTLKNLGNSGSGFIRLSSGGKISLDNTTVQFSNASQTITVTSGGFLEWKNTPTAIQGATLPNNLFAASNVGVAYLEGVDLVALSAKTILQTPTGTFNLMLKDCKLPASITRMGAATSPQPSITLINCDGGDTNYRTEKENYMGAQTIETTIVRTGGASDGTTPIAWKFVSSANAKLTNPFESLPIQIWNDAVGSSKTLTVYGIWGGGAVPNNDDIWIEVEYLGTSGFPLGSVVSSGKADVLAANAALATDTSTWGGSTTKFKMTATFTPQEKGYVTVRIKVGAASATLYIDPKGVIS